MRGRTKSSRKFEAKITSIEAAVKKLSPLIETEIAKSSGNGGDILDAEYIAKLYAPACDLVDRLEGQITKRLKDLVMLREVKRQY